MNCEKYLISIDDLIEGELDEKNAEQVNLHVSGCPECASYYATARREKEIYAQYLFSAEPAPDLWTKFQTKIETAAPLEIVETKNNFSDWNFSFFKSFRLYPALGFALLLIICAVAFLKFVSNKSVPAVEYAAETKLSEQQTTQQFDQADISRTELPAVKINKAENPTKPFKNNPQSVASNQKAAQERNRRLEAKQNKPKEKRIYENNSELQAENQLSKEQQQLKTLDEATAQQIEKIEMLLRSFRNARVVEGSTIYDVAYEKQQARKLLGRNVQLRRVAENYGSMYTEALLDKAEPFLLDIANLENNAQPEKVLDIKERVKTQNIIASLQVY